MSNLVRLEKEKERAQKETNVAIVASDIEFVRLVRGLLQAGNVLNMTDLKSAYSSILESNGAHHIVQPTTQGIKEKISSHIDDIHFMKSKLRNESDCVFSTAVHDAALEDAMAKTSESDIRQLFESASVLQDAIARQNKDPWEFNGELSNDDAEKHYMPSSAGSLKAQPQASKHRRCVLPPSIEMF